MLQNAKHVYALSMWTRREAPDRLVLLQVGLPRRQARLARSVFERDERHTHDRARALQGDQEAARSPIDGVSHAQVHRDRREAVRMEGHRAASAGADRGRTRECSSRRSLSFAVTAAPLRNRPSAVGTRSRRCSKWIEHPRASAGERGNSFEPHHCWGSPFVFPVLQHP